MPETLPRETKWAVFAQQEPSRPAVIGGRSIYAQAHQSLGFEARRRRRLKMNVGSLNRLRNLLRLGAKGVDFPNPVKSEATVSMSMAWVSIEKEIEQFAVRPINWNSYGAAPVSLPCKVTALAMVDLLESEKALALGVNMTGDSDVVISCRIAAYKVKWQIDMDGDIAAMAHDQNGQASFRDMALSEVRRFVQELKDGRI